MAFYRTSPFSTPQPQSLPSPSIVGRRLHKFRLRLTTASVCGTIDCSLRLPTLIPDTAPSSRCRARCLNLRSQTISAFPFRCLFPTPPASLRRRAHSITIRSATSACFSDSSMSVCYFPNSEAHGRHIHDTFRPPIEEKPTAFQLTATFHLTSATPHSTPCRAERIVRSGRVGILPPSIAPPPTPLRFNPRSHEWRGQFVG